jgi:hypothetical protein
MAYGQVADCTVLVHTKQPPSDEEWSAYLDFQQRNTDTTKNVNVLVFTDGGAPTPSQRMQLNDAQMGAVVAKKASVKVATVTTSMFVRGVVTALSWFHPVYRAFSPSQMDQALHYLDVPADKTDEVKRLIKVLKAQLG